MPNLNGQFKLHMDTINSPSKLNLSESDGHLIYNGRLSRRGEEAVWIRYRAMALSHNISGKTELISDNERAKIGNEGCTLGRRGGRGGGGERENNHRGMDGHVQFNTTGTLLLQCLCLEYEKEIYIVIRDQTEAYEGI